MALFISSFITLFEVTNVVSIFSVFASSLLTGAITALQVHPHHLSTLNQSLANPVVPTVYTKTTFKVRKFSSLANVISL